MIGSPCNECTKRTTGYTTDSCHATCPDYKKFRQEVDEAERKRSIDRDYQEFLFGVQLHVHTQKPKEW